MGLIWGPKFRRRAVDRRFRAAPNPNFSDVANATRRRSVFAKTAKKRRAASRRTRAPAKEQSPRRSFSDFPLNNDLRRVLKT